MDYSMDLDFCASQRELQWKLSRASKDGDKDDMDIENDFPDPSIWSNVPYDVIERVILWLPMRSLIRAASVCKDWGSLIFSKGFSDLHTQVPSQFPWFLVFPEEDLKLGLVYDPVSCKWFNLSFSFFPCESRVVATSQGLLCLVPKVSMRKIWYVCNPISKFWRELPSPPGLYKLFFLVVGMFVDLDARSFTIVMAGSELVAEDSEQFILITETYDSTTHCWRKGGSLLLDAPLSPWKAVSGGMMYCVTGSVPYRVLAYDTKRGSWSEVRAPLPEQVTAMKLMDYKGKLLMIGGIGSNGVTRDIGMWELQLRGTDLEWREVGWMPKDVLHQFLKSLSRRFACVGQDDLIYFSSKKCPRVLEHNLCQKSWRWIPRSPHFVNPHYHMLRGFCFQPSLHM